jgi:peptidoglycan/LPS O-acetylase OafA/YrhL
LSDSRPATSIAYQPGLDGGLPGVDVSFVLSGFLITSLSLAEHQANGHFGSIAATKFVTDRIVPELRELAVNAHAARSSKQS